MFLWWDRWDALKLLSESLLNKQTATRKESFSVLSKGSCIGLTPYFLMRGEKHKYNELRMKITKNNQE
jgi:hypothetical protein